MKKAVKYEPPEEGEYIAIVLEAILIADRAVLKHVNRSISTFTEVFVDFNELRAAPVKEISDCIEKTVPERHRKAATISVVLNAIFTASNTLDLSYIRQKSNRDIRRYLRELGLGNFAEAYVARLIFDIHSVPVDQTLLEVLGMNGMIYPGSEIDDTQSFLERIIPQKNNIAANEFFREYIEKNASALDKKRKEDAKRLAAEKAEREAKEEAKRLAEEEKKRKAEERKAARDAKEKARKKAKAAKVAKKKAAAKKAATKKKTVKKKTKAKSTTKKTTKKPTKKSTKKAAKKTGTKKK